MRKKLLRSRSGFEKPESREEAIMQNILGASNVLEPSESNIEEILKSILYNTPYTKEAEFEIEKILLAIKNNGTYDGEGESRDMKILIAILRESSYTEETESRIEELFVEWLQQRQQIKVLEGIPPLTFTSRGLPLINYLIEGNMSQTGTPTPQNPIQPSECGERTGNLFDGELKQGSVAESSSAGKEYNVVTHYPTTKRVVTSNPVACHGATVTWNNSKYRICICYFDKNLGYIGNTSQGFEPWITTGVHEMHKYPYAAIAVRRTDNADFTPEDASDLNLVVDNYKIPISSANTTTPVYLGEVETTRKIKKLVLTGEETWHSSGTYTGSMYAYNSQFFGIAGGKPIFCSHLQYVSNIADYSIGKCITDDNSVSLWIYNTTTSPADFKSYLAQQYANGTPVCVWYVLETEETGIVNEPLRKIGDYADSISMEQTGIEIPTINGSNTFDVNTSVKPSNVYIEYK